MPKICLGVNRSLFDYFRRSRKIGLERAGENQEFPSKTFVSQCQKTLGGNLSGLCFTKFTVAKRIMNRGGYQDFSWKTFCLTVPKIFPGGNPLVLHFFSGMEKVSIRKRRGRIKVFCRKNSISGGRKNSYVKPSVLCSKSFTVAKSLEIREGEYQGFPSESFCLTVPKRFRRGNLLCCVPENFR